jgi:hypothetical protein
MKPTLYVRTLTDDERKQLEADRRTAEAFRMRRAQIVLASARGLSPQPIAQLVGCCVQTVRNVIHAFNTTGLACMSKPTGIWTLALAAQVCHEQGVTARCMSDETIRRALQCLQTNWKRAKHWITSPDPYYARKKSGAIV